ncbi:MAG: hypothetical protein QOE70_6216 [Chthoniobacter sp.]|jgi:hypothetical protein|nr:hypothetical protein [Chthoniobacter sp.]
MSLETAFDSLRRSLADLQETVSALQVTVAEDKPARGEAVIVDQLDALVTDLAGALDEADAHAAVAVQSSKATAELDQARKALHKLHGLMNRFMALYAGELAAHNHIAQLLEMGRERGREWRAWSQEAKTGIDRCAAPMNAAASALLDCWAELAERMAHNSVSVQATNIGQQITLREDQLELSGNIT